MLPYHAKVFNSPETTRQTRVYIILLAKRQLKLTGHCIRMPTDEFANRFVIYESKIRSSLQPDAPSTTYLNQISSYTLPGKKTVEANAIRRMAAKISKWSHIYVVSK